MTRHAVVTETSRSELLSTCRGITLVLGGLESRAAALGMTSQHAALQARLAVFLSRLEAGDSSLSLVLAMTSFVQHYEAHVEVLAPRSDAPRVNRGTT
jgi:hypothetical protein